MNFATKLFCILLGCGIFASLAYAEPRWCSIFPNGGTYAVVYPPIARAAHVSGVIISRITYTSDGRFQDATMISGPPLLSNPISQQMKQWTIKTDATGSDLCQSLVILDFALDPLGTSETRQRFQISPSILRISIVAIPTVLSDPAAIITTKHRFPFFHRKNHPVD